MKRLLVIVGIILAVAAATTIVLKYLPGTSMREDFVCE